MFWSVLQAHVILLKLLDNLATVEMNILYIRDGVLLRLGVLQFSSH